MGPNPGQNQNSEIGSYSSQPLYLATICAYVATIAVAVGRRGGGEMQVDAICGPLNFFLLIFKLSISWMMDEGMNAMAKACADICT